MTIVTKIKRRLCRHTFRLSDLRKTGIEPPQAPVNGNYKDWEAWYAEKDSGLSCTRRVLWPCCKCGKEFYAHCGLDISPEHGPTVQEQPTKEAK